MKVKFIDNMSNLKDFAKDIDSFGGVKSNEKTEGFEDVLKNEMNKRSSFFSDFSFQNPSSSYKLGFNYDTLEKIENVIALLESHCDEAIKRNERMLNFYSGEALDEMILHIVKETVKNVSGITGVAMWDVATTPMNYSNNTFRVNVKSELGDLNFEVEKPKRLEYEFLYDIEQIEQKDKDSLYDYEF